MYTTLVQCLSHPPDTPKVLDLSSGGSLFATRKISYIKPRQKGSVSLTTFLVDAKLQSLSGNSAGSLSLYSVSVWQLLRRQSGAAASVCMFAVQPDQCGNPAAWETTGCIHNFCPGIYMHVCSRTKQNILHRKVALYSQKY